MKAIILYISPLFSELCKFTYEEQSEECAFSVHSDFSRNGEAKIGKFWIRQYKVSQNFFFGEERWF